MPYEFTKLRLEACEFDNLVFMNPPPSWERKPEEHEFLLSICTVSLKEVVKKVIGKSNYNGDDPTEVFKNIDVFTKSKDKPWFQRHAAISQDFDKGRMGELWIRNLSNYSGGERGKCPAGSFYVEDGNHRALVYAMHIEFGKMKYSPVDAMHATSWDIIVPGLLNFLPQKAVSLEHDGKLQDEKCLRNEFQLPIGIQINTYERS